MCVRVLDVGHGRAHVKHIETIEFPTKSAHKQYPQTFHFFIYCKCIQYTFRWMVSREFDFARTMYAVQSELHDGRIETWSKWMVSLHEISLHMEFTHLAFYCSKQFQCNMNQNGTLNKTKIVQRIVCLHHWDKRRITWIALRTIIYQWMVQQLRLFDWKRDTFV